MVVQCHASRFAKSAHGDLRTSRVRGVSSIGYGAGDVGDGVGCGGVGGK